MKLKEKPTSLNRLFAFSDATKITLDNFRTENVQSMELMFLHCSYLTELEASDLDTSSVTSMYGMFELCTSLTKLDLSGWVTSNVEKMGMMFAFDTKLKELNLVNMNIPKITDSDNINRFLYSISSLEKCTYYSYKSDISTQFHRDCSDLLGFKYCGDCTEETEVYCTKSIEVGSQNLLQIKTTTVTKKFFYVYEEKNLNKTQKSCYYLSSKTDDDYIKKEDLGIYFKEKCDESCESCNSIEIPKCIECNKGFYPLANETKEEEKFCYNELTAPKNFYLEDDVFKQCSTSCSSCTIESDNCIQCETNYYQITVLNVKHTIIPYLMNHNTLQKNAITD